MTQHLTIGLAIALVHYLSTFFFSPNYLSTPGVSSNYMSAKFIVEDVDVTFCLSGNPNDFQISENKLLHGVPRQNSQILGK